MSSIYRTMTKIPIHRVQKRPPMGEELSDNDFYTIIMGSLVPSTYDASQKITSHFHIVYRNAWLTPKGEIFETHSKDLGLLK